MADTVLSLILSIRKSGTGAKDAEKDLKALNKASADGVKSLTGFNIAGVSAVGAITAVGAAAVDAVKATLEWAGAVDRLSTNTGLSTEEASKLAVVAGDVGIEIKTLEKSLKAMNKDGLELNFETLKKVSQQYSATTDPVKRLKIATDAFGGAAQDMTEILSRSPEQLEALARSAELSGKIMSGESVAAAEQFETSLKVLQDRIEGLKVQVGNGLIPVLNNAFTTLDEGPKLLGLLNVKFQESIGIIDDAQAALKMQAIANGDLMATYQQQVPVVENLADARETDTRATNDNSVAQSQLATQTAALNSVWQNYGPLVSDAAVKNAEYQKTLEPLTGAASDLQFALGELTTATLFNEAAQGLDSGAALELAKSMGMIDQKTLDAKNALDEARVKFDENRDGVISATEAANGYADAVLRINDQLNAAQHAADAAAAALARAMANGAGAGGGGVIAGGGQGGNSGFATGGSFVVGGTGSTDTTMVSFPATPGEVVTVSTPTQQAHANDNRTWNVYVDARGASDPRAVEQAGYRGAKRALAESGYNADLRSRV